MRYSFDLSLPRKKSYQELLDEPLPEDLEDKDYIPLEDGPPKKKARRGGRRRAKTVPDLLTTDKMFKPKGQKGFLKRPDDYGEVTIESETIDHTSLGPLSRPRSVSGLVFPTATTGRPSAPEAASGTRVGIKWKEVGKRSDRNTGIVDAQKGHIMALELGGPDIPENIVPQWANFQANGAWRRAETAALKLAKEAESRGNRLHFQVDVHYKDYEHLEHASRKGLTVPTGFLMVVTEQDTDGKALKKGQILFDEEQAQDETDLRISGELFDEVDKMEFTLSDDQQ
jgi:hypothetical protein